MSVLKNFKTTPGRPMGVTGPRCNFFLNLQRGLWPKKNERGACRPPQRATGGLSPPLGRPVAPAHRRDRGGAFVAPLGRPGHTTLYKHPTPIPSSFEPENSTKKPEKKERGEEKESGEALPDSALVICRLVHLVYVFFHWYCRVI